MLLGSEGHEKLKWEGFEAEASRPPEANVVGAEGALRTPEAQQPPA
jgi:hypothetical protein